MAKMPLVSPTFSQSARLAAVQSPVIPIVAELIRAHRPDVLHATNTFPLISPSVCDVAHRAGVAVVQALRNYRLLCANSYLMRDGHPCEECVGRAIPWPAVRRQFVDARAPLPGLPENSGRAG